MQFGSLADKKNLEKKHIINKEMAIKKKNTLIALQEMYPSTIPLSLQYNVCDAVGEEKTL